MAILGKDLWGGESENFFEFNALFSGDRIEIGGISYHYGQITTDFLNYDSSDYKKAMESLTSAHSEKNFEQYVEISKTVNNLILSMPLYKEFTKTENLMADYGYEMVTGIDLGLFLDDDVFHHYEVYLELGHTFDFILPRYRWFLEQMVQEKTKGKRGGNRYAVQIEENRLSPYVSGVSLGADIEVDPAEPAVKYEVRISAEDGTAKLYEKMQFTHLSDFVHTDFFRGLMKESIPKTCRLCGRYFLQEEGVSYEYCDHAPLNRDKTCREIGALASFQNKVKSNEVWQIHQRAYKKYYARVMKGTMTKGEFHAWRMEAEQTRDIMLKHYEEAKEQGTQVDLTEYTEKLNRL